MNKIINLTNFVFEDLHNEMRIAWPVIFVSGMFSHGTWRRKLRFLCPIRSSESTIKLIYALRSSRTF